MADMLNNMNLEVLKVPLGFIRILELPIVIIAFATASGYHADMTYTTKNCNGTGTGATSTGLASWAYPLTLSDVQVTTNVCSSATETPMKALFVQSFTSQAQFFVFTGVVSFLFILGMLAVYLFWWGNYENDRRWPLIDLGVTGVLTLFWFAGTIAWAAAVTIVNGITSKDALQTRLAELDATCKKGTGCTVDGSLNSSGIIISVVAGFGCVVVFCGNLWFVYKETELFKNRQGPPPVGNLPGDVASPSGPYP